MIENLFSSVVQINALSKTTPEVSISYGFKLFALVTSLLMMMSTIVNVDLMRDNSVEGRLKYKEFYGIVSSSGFKRFAAINFMRLMTLSQSLLRFCGLVLLKNKGGFILVSGVMGVEFGLLSLYKAVRGDLGYWINMSGVGYVLVSSLVSFIGWQLSTGLSMMHMRHPYETGAFMRLVGIGVVHSTTLYLAFSGLEFEELTMPMRWVKLLIVVLVGVYWASFAGFLFVCERDLIHTFSNFTTSQGFVRSVFEAGRDNAAADIFSKNRRLWKGIEVDLSEWIKERWETWEEEKPDWYTSKWQRKVPEEMRAWIKTQGLEIGRKGVIKKKKVGEGFCRRSLLVVARGLWEGLVGVRAMWGVSMMAEGYVLATDGDAYFD